MRTTVTIDPDVQSLLRAAMKESGSTFKDVLNEAIRTGLRQKPPRRARKLQMPTFKMGFHPEVRLDKALALAAALEDEEIARKLSVQK